MFKSLYNHLFHSEKTESELTQMSIVNKEDMCGFKFNIIPDGWILYMLRQTPTFCLWDCMLVDLFGEKDKEGCCKTVTSEDCYDPLDAIQQAVKKIGK